MKQEALQGQLETVDRSLYFLILIICSVLLSFWAVTLQRRQLADTIRGDSADAAALPPVFPIRLTAGTLVTAALGYFFALALDTLDTAEQGQDPTAQRSARVNVWASLFVLAAALLRLDDLVYVESQGQFVTKDSTLPA